MDTPKPRHSITDFDLETMTGTCTVCGSGAKIKARKTPHRISCWKREHDHRMVAYTPEVRRDQRRGLPPGGSRKMWESQGRRCKICGVGLEYDSIHTDHDHSTGKVRGILCRNCNTALGKFKDDPALLRRAASYIETEGLTSVSESNTVIKSDQGPEESGSDHGHEH